jgi:adenosine kinase
VSVAAVPPHRIIDPTGVGDAFRGGLLKGLAVGADLETCARLGSVAATYALEHLGGQSHAYTWEEFRDRYEAHFGALARIG